MSFFGNLMNSAGKTVLNQARNERYQVVLPQIPTNVAQLQAMPQADLTKPENTAALTIAAFCMYPIDKEACFEMLTFSHGPKGLSTYDKQFIAERFRDKDYVPRSYFEGATPQNNYEPQAPYTLTFFENPYSRDHIGEGYLTLHVKSGGADSARQIKLRQKTSTGQWFLWEQFLLADVRQPVSADPWA